MRTLPESSIDTTNGITFREYHSLTFYVDPIHHRLSGMCDGYQAVKQAIEVMLSVERFYWQIYSPRFGMEWKGLVGQMPGYVAAELHKRVREALSIDNRILGVSQFTYTNQEDKLTAHFTVETVFGDVEQEWTVVK